MRLGFSDFPIFHPKAREAKSVDTFWGAAAAMKSWKPCRGRLREHDVGNYLNIQCLSCKFEFLELSPNIPDASFEI